MRPSRKQKTVAGAIAALVVAGGGGAIAGAELWPSAGHAAASSQQPASSRAEFQPRGTGFDRGGFGFAGGGFGFAGGGGNLGAAASYLGLNTPSLQADLGKGQTLAAIAKAQRKSVDGLVSALISAEKTTIQSAVSAGRLPASFATQIEASLEQRVSAMVNGTFAGPGRSFGPGRGGYNGFGRRGARSFGPGAPSGSGSSGTF